MPKFIKKPVEIEAVKWTGENHREMWEFLEQRPIEYIHPHGDNFYIDHDQCEGGLIIKTLKGEHKASIGDFIIKGIKGEYYPCKPDIFKATYFMQEELHEIPCCEGTMEALNDLISIFQ